MLPFSSITSIVPLFILAFAYLVYFSASVLSRHIPQSSDASGEKVIVKAETNSIYANYPDFRCAADDHPVKAASFHYDFSLKDISCIFLHEIPHGKPVPHHPISQFSPRPPPVA